MFKGFLFKTIEIIAKFYFFLNKRKLTAKLKCFSLFLHSHKLNSDPR